MSETLSVIYCIGALITFGLSDVWMLVLMDYQNDDADIGLIVPAALGAMMWPLTWTVGLVMLVYRQVKGP